MRDRKLMRDRNKKAYRIAKPSKGELQASKVTSKNG